jgi:hypothetical protein
MDRYTKIVLTVIAVSLSVIATRQVIDTATAQSSGECGFGFLPPCEVFVENWPLSLR